MLAELDHQQRQRLLHEVFDMSSSLAMSVAKELLPSALMTTSPSEERSFQLERRSLTNLSRTCAGHSLA